MMPTVTPVTTIFLSTAAFVFGIPFAVAAIILNDNWVPDVVLGSKTFGTGPGQTTTIEFGLLTGANDAVYAGALISMTCTALFAIGVVLTRHFTKHNGFGWLVFGPALLNLLSQIGCCAAAYLFQKKYPVATSTDQIRQVNGRYTTGGVLYTKESWACSLNTLYANSEGHWAEPACSRFGAARTLTIPFVLCAVCVFGMSYWQVREKGGFRWLFGSSDKIIAAYKPTNEYIHMKS